MARAEKQVFRGGKHHAEEALAAGFLVETVQPAYLDNRLAELILSVNSIMRWLRCG